MTGAGLHREDIKAKLRKRHGTLGAFEKARNLKAKSVTDVLRGKQSRRTAEAIAKEINVSIHDLFPGRFVSAKADNSLTCVKAHPQS